MNQWHLFAWAYAQVNNRLDGTIDAIIGALAAWVTPILQVGAVAYLASMAIVMVVTSNEAPLGKTVMHAMRIAAVLFLVSSVGAYRQNGANVLLNLPNELSAALGGGGVGNNADQFDNLWNDAWVGGQKVFLAAPSGFAAIGKTVVIGIAILGFLVVAVVAIGFSFLVSLIAIVTLKFAIAFGPIFLACFAFEFSKRIGDSWLAVCLSCVVTLAMVSGLIVILTAVEHDTLAQITTPPAGQDDNVITMLQSLFSCGVVFFIAQVLVRELPGIAARITHGVDISVRPYTQSMATAGSGIASGAAMAGRSGSAAGAAASAATTSRSSMSVNRTAGRSLSGGA